MQKRMRSSSKKVEKHKKLKKHKAKNVVSRSNPVEEDLESLSEDPAPLKTKLKSKSKIKPNTKSGKKLKGADEMKKHKEQLEQLKDIDPEFYKFLKQNDKKLLEFNFYDSEDDVEEGSGKEDQEGSDEEDEEVHKPAENLEVASDESDFESSDNETADTDSRVITLKLLRNWQGQLQEKHVPIDIIRKVIQAFGSALASISGDDHKTAAYKVDGSAAFNGVVQLCVLHLQPAVYRYLGLSLKSKKPIHKCSKWKKVRSCLRSYLVDLTKLLEHVSSENILRVLLKHFHQLSSMIASFSAISKPILKRLIVLWSTSDETVRVLAFLCILKITRNQQGALLNHVLKAMYLSYVRNSKFVSPNTLPGINFMRRSLVEMFALDLNVAYQHVFLYIRQLAIHLRNAIVLKKKDSFQAVYNWQFINSIRLWTELLGATYNRPQLQPLLYPLVSITTGVVKLIPTAQFFPLRFHCVQALIMLSRETNTFIPVLPFILEVLNSNTFNKKHTVMSMRPMSFACVLRLNKSQMAENGFRDEVVENVFGLTLQYLAHESSSIAFPDLVVPAVVAIKQYLKSCKVSNYSRKMKQLLDKVIENSKLIEDARMKITFGLKDAAEIKAWETIMRNKQTPLDIYYQSWVKTHETKKKRQAANTDDISDYKIPVIKKRRVDKTRVVSEDGVELFPSDSEDEDVRLGREDDDGEKRTNAKKQKAVKKNQQADVGRTEEHAMEEDMQEDGVDIVKDLDIDDW